MSEEASNSTPVVTDVSTEAAVASATVGRGQAAGAGAARCPGFFMSFLLPFVVADPAAVFAVHHRLGSIWSWLDD